MLPTLVLLPGMDGTGELFSPLLAALDGEFDTLIVRYPTDKALGYAELTTLTQSQVPAGKRFVLLAESFSGPIAISIAASKARGLAGLILCASFAKNPRPKLRHLIVLLGMFPLRWVPTSVLSHLFLGRFATEELRGKLKAILKRVDRAVLRLRLWSIVSVDVSNELARIDVPALYLMASEDRLVPSKAATPFGQLPTNWKITKINGPHLLLQSVPGEVSIAISSFLKSLG